MISLSRFQLAFTPSFKMCLLTFLSMALFCSLGVWQLRRADEKKQMLVLAKQQEKKGTMLWKPSPSPSTDHLPEQYQSIQVKGHFLPTLLLLDNQHYQHQFGYHVLSPLVLSKNLVVIVDRGWIPKENAGKIRTPSQALTLTGNVYYPSSKQWVLGEAIDIQSSQLAYIEKFDPQLIGQFLQKSVYPFIIRQQENTPYGYVRHWVTVNMPWQRHLAYAFQWFAIASVIFFIFIGLNLKYERKA